MVGDPGWLQSCRREAEARGLERTWVEALRAFGTGGDESPSTPAFSTLMTQAAETSARLPETIRATLSHEVDPAQAGIFARRFGAVATLLAGLPPFEARLLQVGLARRTTQVLEGPAPRALRVRAVVDFYYSQAAVLHHQGYSRDLTRVVDALRWRTATPGLRHGHVSGPGPRGPLHINVLTLEGGRFEARDLRDDEADLVRATREAGALAAVSGGFFLYSEPDILPPSRRTDPVGLLVHGGEVLNPPSLYRAALLQDADGSRRIAPTGPAGLGVRWSDTWIRVAAHNRPPHQAPTAFNRAWGPRSPAHPGPTVAIVGRQVTAVGRGALDIPLAGFALALPDGTAPLPQPGAPVRFSLPGPVTEAMGAGPTLVRHGRPVRTNPLPAEDFAGTAPPITFSQDETFDQNLLPRMAAGLRPDGALVLAAIDGRNFERAPGFTLAMTADLMVALGCETAMNMDGGSSKRMVVGGRVVDLPSTEVVAGATSEARVRPVHSAVLLFGDTARGPR